MEFELQESAGSYRGVWKDKSVEAHVSRLREHSDRVTAEITIINFDPGFTKELYNGNLTLGAPRSRAELAEHLESRRPLEEGDWEKMVEMLCSAISKRLREGDPAVRMNPRSESKLTYLVEPLIAEKKLNIIYGPGESGKSFLALFLAYLVQNGLCEYGFETPKKYNVLYLDWETEEDDIDFRCRQVVNGLGAFELESPHYRHCAASFADDAPRLAAMVEELNISLIIVDSLGPAMAGNYQRQEDGVFAFQKASRTIGKTILGIAHVSKEMLKGGKGTKLPFGSIFLWNMARMCYEIKTSDGQQKGDKIIGLFNRKANVTSRPDPVALRMHWEGEALFFERTDAMPEFPEEQSQAEQVLSLLKGGAKSTKDVAEYLEVGPNHAGGVLRRLLQRKAIMKLPNGTWGVMESVHNER